LFGWEFENVMPKGTEAKYFIGRLRGGDVAAIGSIPEGAPSVAMWNTYVWVDSADETASRVGDAGGAVLTAPLDVMDAGRMAVLTDPERAAFSVWQAKDHKGATIVNEHGSLNFNGLVTRNPEDARAFYGAVFGWKTLALQGGEMWTGPKASSTLLRLSTRLRTTTPERRRTGASPSPSTTPTPRQQERESSAARSSPVHSMLLGPGWR
jgi:hypothetical protein